jgi:signal transduction histidine kinase
MASLAQPDVLGAVLDVARRVLRADGFAVWRLEDGAWKIRAFSGISDAFAHAAVTTYGASPAADVLSNDPLIFRDVRSEPLLAERRPVYEREGIHSLAVIPLIVNGRATGSLVMYYRAPHDFSDEEIGIARALAGTAAAAVSARERAEFLDRAGIALGQSLDLAATAQTVADLAVPFFADACAIHVPDGDGEVRLAAAAHVNPEKRAPMLLLAGRPRPNRARGWGRTIVDGTVELFEEIDERAISEALRDDPVMTAAFHQLALVSQLSVPMRARGRLVGAITFAYGPGARRYSTADVELAMELARRCATAIDNARLYDEAQRREAEAAQAEDRARFLADVAAGLAASLVYDETLRNLARLAVPRIADWCAIDIVDAEGVIARLAALHVDPAKSGLVEAIVERYDHGRSPYSAHHVIQTAQPVLLPDITDAMVVAAARGDEERIRLVRALGLRSYMCVPLVVRGRAYGAFSFAAAESGRLFTQSDLRFAQDLASRAALAVENARAYAEARRANHVKDEFLATLSHELRTPLNAILGYSRMLRDGTIGPDRHPRAFEIVERNAAALAQIVSDILDVSRITAGKLRLEPRPIDLAHVVRDALAAIMPAADAKGVRVSTRIDAPIGPVAADADRLQQVVWNLVSNAVKFTPKDGRVEVAIEPDDGQAVLTVRDTGSGIAPEFLPHVFERFRQGDPRLAREHGGLGIGLAIARHLVEMHGGSIHASSDGPGRGAVFSVRLPLAVGATAREESPA